MTTAATSAARTTPLERFSPIGGLLFPILVVLILAVSGSSGDTAEEVTAYAAENSGRATAAQIMAMAATVALAWFVAGLYSRLRRVDATTTPVLAAVGGTVATTLFYVAMAIWYAPLIDSDELSPEAYLTIDDIGWVILGGAGLAAGLMIIATSLIALRERWAPAWAAWLGVLLGVLGFATVAAIGGIAVLVWLAVASVGMLVRERGRSNAAGFAP